MESTQRLSEDTDNRQTKRAPTNGVRRFKSEFTRPASPSSYDESSNADDTLQHSSPGRDDKENMKTLSGENGEEKEDPSSMKVQLSQFTSEQEGDGQISSAKRRSGLRQGRSFSYRTLVSRKGDNPSRSSFRSEAERSYSPTVSDSQSVQDEEFKTRAKTCETESRSKRDRRISSGASSSASDDPTTGKSIQLQHQSDENLSSSITRYERAARILKGISQETPKHDDKEQSSHAKLSKKSKKKPPRTKQKQHTGSVKNELTWHSAQGQERDSMKDMNFDTLAFDVPKKAAEVLHDEYLEGEAVYLTRISIARLEGDSGRSLVPPASLKSNRDFYMFCATNDFETRPVLEAKDVVLHPSQEKSLKELSLPEHRQWLFKLLSASARGEIIRLFQSFGGKSSRFVDRCKELEENCLGTGVLSPQGLLDLYSYAEGGILNGIEALMRDCRSIGTIKKSPQLSVNSILASAAGTMASMVNDAGNILQQNKILKSENEKLQKKASAYEQQLQTSKLENDARLHEIEDLRSRTLELEYHVRRSAECNDHNRAAAKELRVVIKCILDNLRDAIQLLQSVEEVPESAIQMLTQAINGVYESKAYI